MITPISPEHYFILSKRYPVIDVRSPQEFIEGHLPGAHNVPLFSDDQRALVGTIYKKQGKHEAIAAGLELVGPQLNGYVEQVEYVLAPFDTNRSAIHSGRAATKESLIVYCWRGGMRSKSFGMLLATCGYTVYQVIGGYKACKKYLHDVAQKPYQFIVLGGKTGCGKTKVLQELHRQGEQVLDLEQLAHHKGSVFGGLGQSPQPSQEQFIVNCLSTLAQFDMSRPIWIEKESYKIGNLSVPYEIWRPLQQAPIMYIDIPKEERIKNILEEYGCYKLDDLKACIQPLHKKIGRENVQKIGTLWEAGNHEQVIHLLLAYYDKLYAYGEQKSAQKNIFHLQLAQGTTQEYAQKLKEIGHVHQRQITQWIPTNADLQGSHNVANN